MASIYALMEKESSEAWGLLKMIFMTGKTLLQMFALYIRKKRIATRE